MTNAQPEPSMEEILASIRRIISEDEEEGAAEAAPEAAPEAVSAPTLVAETVEEETVSDPFEAVEALSAEMEPEAQEEQIADQSDDQANYATEEVEMIKQNVAESFEDDPLVGEETAAVASQAFKNLSASVRVSDGPGRTLEDIVSEMLRPIVKEWLDANLPAIVEEKVEEEVQRVARRRG